MFIYKKILLALDISKNSERAIHKVIELQKKWGSEVVLFHSTKHPTLKYSYAMALASQFGTYFMTEEEIQIKYEQLGKKILEDTKQMFDEVQVPVKTRLIKEKYPEDYIIDIVEKEDFDLVVLGIKGVHSKLREKIIGTVAKKVVKHASCDVLVVR